MTLLPSRFRRRHFLLGGGLVGIVYMRFVEAQWLSVGRHSLRLSKGQQREPFTVLHLSDFHASKVIGLDYLNRAVTRALAACRPDLVCLTGDFISSRWEDWAGYGRIFRG